MVIGLARVDDCVDMIVWSMPEEGELVDPPVLLSLVRLIYSSNVERVDGYVLG